MQNIRLLKYLHIKYAPFTHTKKKKTWGELDGDARWSPRQMKDEIFWEGKEWSDSGPIGLEVGGAAKST